MLKVIITDREEAKELKIMLEKMRKNASIFDTSGRQIGYYFYNSGFRSSCSEAMNAMAHYYNLIRMTVERDLVKFEHQTR